MAADWIRGAERPIVTVPSDDQRRVGSGNGVTKRVLRDARVHAIGLAHVVAVPDSDGEQRRAVGGCWILGDRDAGCDDASPCGPDLITAMLCWIPINGLVSLRLEEPGRLCGFHGAADEIDHQERYCESHVTKSFDARSETCADSGLCTLVIEPE